MGRDNYEGEAIGQSRRKPQEGGVTGEIAKGGGKKSKKRRTMPINSNQVSEFLKKKKGHQRLRIDGPLQSQRKGEEG